MNISITLAKLARLMNQLPKPDFKDSCCLSNDILFREKHRDVFLPLKRTDCCWNCACASCAGSLTTSQWRPSEKWRTFNPSSEKKVSPHAIWLNLQRPASAWLCYWGRMLGGCFPSIFRLVYSIFVIWNWAILPCNVAIFAGSFGGDLHWLPRPWHRVPWLEFLQLRTFMLKGSIFNLWDLRIPDEARWLGSPTSCRSCREHSPKRVRFHNVKEFSHVGCCNTIDHHHHHHQHHHHHHHHHFITIIIILILILMIPVIKRNFCQDARSVLSRSRPETECGCWILRFSIKVMDNKSRLEDIYCVCMHKYTMCIYIWVSDKIRYDQSSIERVVGLPLLQNR